MKTLTVRYLGETLISSEGGVLINGNDYEVVDENDDELLLSYYDNVVPYEQRTTYEIWAEKTDCKPVKMVSANNLTFQNDFWSYDAIMPEGQSFDRFKELSCSEKFQRNVKQIAPHFFEIETDDKILICHIVGNFESTEFGKVVVEHLTIK